MNLMPQTVLSTAIRGLGLAVLIVNLSDDGYSLQIDQPLSNEERPDHHVVTGTLDQLDFDKGKGLLKTDLGKPIFFEMIQPELFRRLSVGQRVTIGMNEQGQAVKVMEDPPVELQTPPSAIR